MVATSRAPLGPRTPAFRRLIRLVAVVSALGLVASCGKDDPMRPAAGVVTMGTPEDAVHAALGSWTSRDTSAYFALLAPGGFYFSVCTEGSQLTLTDVHDDQGERYSAARLFRLGTESLPPAISIGISIDGPLTSYSYEDPTTALVDVPMTLGVVTPAGTTFHRGRQFIQLVRGDAVLPSNPADSTRWLIDGWGEILVGDEPPPSPDAIRRLIAAVRSRAAAWPRVAGGSYCDSALATTWSRVKTQYLEGYTGSPFVPFRAP